MRRLLRLIITIYKKLEYFGSKVSRAHDKIPTFVKTIFVLCLLGILALALIVLSKGKNMPIWNPSGVVALQQKQLLVTALFLSAIIVIPVFILAFTTYVRFGESRKNTHYAPHWDGSRLLESIWWGVPMAIILVLSVLTWQTSHKLDPFRPIESTEKPLKIQVVSLNWRWLFIYPEQGIASLNEAYIPVGRPVDFEITADSPMNSFWVPGLGSQIYAMNGMTTHLHAMTNKQDTYRGSGANITGEGFASMYFTIRSADELDFNEWVIKGRTSMNSLDGVLYVKISEPRADPAVQLFRLKDDDIFQIVLDKYMGGHTDNKEGHSYEALHKYSMRGE